MLSRFLKASNQRTTSRWVDSRSLSDGSASNDEVVSRLGETDQMHAGNVCRKECKADHRPTERVRGHEIVACDGLAVLRALPSWLIVLAAAALAWLLQRSWPLVAFVTLALLFIMNQGYWAATIETVALVAVATLAATAIGVPLGIAAAHRPRLYAALRPVLDLMQTLPTFVYLIPTLVLFGLGVVPGLISTVIFALPAPVRLTHLGISSVPRALLEAGDAFGATPWQRLRTIELPAARASILAGITQCIMLSLSMVVIAALVGAGGLGVPVVRALNSVQVDVGFEAGLAIVLLAIILDRLSRPRDGRTSS